VTRLMTAHTEDDQAETLLMRLDRQTGWRGLAGMPQEAYAPLWPALAGVHLYRPWLNKSRQALRDYNRQYSLSFIDDPSNENTDFARIRARQALAVDLPLRTDLLLQQKEMRARLIQERQEQAVWLKRHASLNAQGYIETAVAPAPELLLHILNAAAGQGGPIDAAKRKRLSREMVKPDFKAATLGGAWILRRVETSNQTEPAAQRHSFVFLRDRSAVTGRSHKVPLEKSSLDMNEPTVWDGRFFCRAKQRGLHVEAGLGHLQFLRQFPEFKALFECPKAVRESLPIFFMGDKPVGFGACDSEFVTSTATSALRLQAMFEMPKGVSK